ncbi:integral peroxisomal membrane peroxin-domain-containing protein [Dactylonectria macrodidyma]|uniref:Integral peroxisomal membrane peroxin-domain-containing protein n=1 Tax=Dactylonectria macrodidyma TaxID=307937 RepID=A0A9P9FTA6_9HYPO|nr:integral peroxisomal membrane peroxin-domain-containing protein [Dactylonectria macrodidyma]
MAALDTPWLSHISSPMSSRDDASIGASPSSYDSHLATGAPLTYATFSPVTLSGHTPSRSSHRSTILVHQKSPLLLATPPQITRALAYSHPFLLPLNTLAGLLTWSTGDPWESFLLVCAFWAVVLYGDVVVTWAGPVVVGAGLIAGMYGRRYSPLSSSGWTDPRSLSREASSKKSNQAGTDGSQPKTGKAGGGDKKPAKHKRGDSEITNTKHQKTLDEIVETLKEFTGRCNTLLDPMLELTDFLSTQRTPTSATTRPALTVIFMRLLIITPIWIALTVPPWRVITTRRVILVAGTVALTWHARVMRVFRAILWRSLTVRRLAAGITGLYFEAPDKMPEGNVQDPAKSGQGRESELTKALRQPASFQTNHRRSGSTRTAGVKFTFIIYENQRRWLGLGWTNSLFAYERPAWTDEHNNTVPARDDFELPEVEDGSRMEWRWVEGGRWRVDGVTDDQGSVDYDGEEGKNGWIFYDNKWQNGQRGQDGWSRWTRRRKWYRDAELVEVDQSHLPHELDASEPNPASASTPSLAIPRDKATSDRAAPSSRSDTALPLVDQTIAEDLSTDDASSRADDALSVLSTSSRSFFRSPLMRKRLTDRSSTDKERTRRTSDVRNEEDASSLGAKLTVEIQKPGDGGRWGIGDEARMSLE